MYVPRLTCNCVVCPRSTRSRLFCRRCLRTRQCFVSMWLVRRSTGEPAYFQCAIVPLEDISSTMVPSPGSAMPNMIPAPPRTSTETDLRLSLPGR